MKAGPIAMLFLLISVLAWARRGPLKGSWVDHVPVAERARVNPYASDSEAAAAGRTLFAEHCAQCHGENALGRRGPSLRSARIEHATDGELAWILRNGQLRKGMPAWKQLPEPERWQIIAYLRSLPAGDAARQAVRNTAGPPQRNAH